MCTIFYIVFRSTVWRSDCPARGIVEALHDFLDILPQFSTIDDLHVFLDGPPLYMENSAHNRWLTWGVLDVLPQFSTTDDLYVFLDGSLNIGQYLLDSPTWCSGCPASIQYNGWLTYFFWMAHLNTGHYLQSYMVFWMSCLNSVQQMTYMMFWMPCLRSLSNSSSLEVDTPTTPELKLNTSRVRKYRAVHLYTMTLGGGEGRSRQLWSGEISLTFSPLKRMVWKEGRRNTIYFFPLYNIGLFLFWENIRILKKEKKWNVIE